MIKGSKHSEEARRKIGAASLGRAHSPETKRKMSESQAGERSTHWGGGKIVDKDGYIRIFLPSHPCAGKSGYVCEHRLVMESHLGRTLLPTEVVHHINGVITDNRIENLLLFSGQSQHSTYHEARKKEKTNE